MCVCRFVKKVTKGMSITMSEYNCDYDFTVDPEENKTEFVRSVEEFVPKYTLKKKKFNTTRFVSKLIYFVIILVCLAVLAWGIFTIIMNVSGYARAEKLYSGLAEIFHSSNSPLPELDEDKYETRNSPALKSLQSSVSLSQIRQMKLENVEITINDTNAEAAQYRAKFDWLKKINPDIYGWITIENTVVDYPIVCGADNEYYLNHDYEGKTQNAGSIFADFRSDRHIINNYNTVLYGHNMNNGSMFNIIEQMTEDEELFDTARIKVLTPDGIYVYAPISVYETDAYDQYYRMQFANTRQFTDFAKSLLEKSVYPRTAEFKATDRILTLSTCTNDAYTGRYALHARLIDVEVFE